MPDPAPQSPGADLHMAASAAPSDGDGELKDDAEAIRHARRAAASRTRQLGARALRRGARLARRLASRPEGAARDFALGSQATRSEPVVDDGRPEHGVMLRSPLSWPADDAISVKNAGRPSARAA